MLVKKLLVSNKIWFKHYLFFFVLFCSDFSYAGIPTMDPVALVQAVVEYQKQIQQYQTQLHQYEDMIKNSKLPKDFVWGDVSNVLAELKKKQSELDEIKKLIGDVDTFAEFKTTDSWKENPCLSTTNDDDCNAEELSKLSEQQQQSVDVKQKSIASAYVLSIKAQEEVINDTQLLQQLQQKAQKATGANEIAQITNQITALQTKQLLRKNELLAEQIRQQAIKDKLDSETQAQRTAIFDKKIYVQNYGPSPNGDVIDSW